MIDEIVDKIIQEAFRRGDYLPGKVCEIKVEIGLKLFEILESWWEAKRSDPKQTT